MKFYKINSECIQEPDILQIVELLNNGGVIGYPTETVYGLGCDGLNSEAVRRIYRIKRRDYLVPLIALVSDKLSVKEFVTDISESAEILMNEFWPGPLTLIFEASSLVPEILRGEKKTIGLRISSDPICRCLLKKFNRPLVSTSANLSGSMPANSAEEVEKYFKDEVDLIIDGGIRDKDFSSTVLDLSRSIPAILREGCISRSDIQDKIGKIR